MHFKAGIFAFIAIVTSVKATAVIRQAGGIDPAKFYTLSRDTVQYLDSTNSVLAVQEHDSASALASGSDKGVRFRFPQGLPGQVVCEAHDDHVVGLDGNSWSTNVDSSKGSAAVAEFVDDSGISLGFGGKFVGPNAEVGTNQFAWKFAEIPGVPL